MSALLFCLTVLLKNNSTFRFNCNNKQALLFSYFGAPSTLVEGIVVVNGPVGPHELAAGPQAVLFGREVVGGAADGHVPELVAAALAVVIEPTGEAGAAYWATVAHRVRADLLWAILTT